jgi:hypothetical protein
MPSKKVDRPVRDIRIRRFPARRSYDIACDRDMRDAWEQPEVHAPRECVEEVLQQSSILTDS